MWLGSIIIYILKGKSIVITVTARESFAGFSLLEPLQIKEGITVITGKNGCGKTRLLEIIESHADIFSEHGERVYAKKFNHGSFSPDFTGNDDGTSLETKRQQAVETFTYNRAAFESPLDQYSRRAHFQGFDHDELYRLCKKIMQETGKSYAEIMPEDIRAHYEEPNGRLFGSQDLARLFNSHIKKDFELRYAFIERFINSDAETLTRKDVLELKRDDSPPWDVLNQVLFLVFGQKFYFSPPDEHLRNFNQPVRLLHSSTGLDVPASQLSSGEKTLMWLTLTLFNSQFFEVGPLVPRVLLLDEPDAFLHPQMVEKMYDVLSVLVREYNVHIVITTHSPTTVALARGEIYKVEGGGLILQDKDSAIAELLDGVTQLSIDPENQRQVFVENRSDAIVYQWLFSSIVKHTGIVDPKVSLSFIPAGPKTPDEYLKVCVKKIFTMAKDDEIRELVNLVNGMGDCGQVEVYVKALTSAKNKSVRGIVDWDTDNRKRADGVIVAAQNYAYSLENILLDPLCVLQMVRLKNHEKYSFFEICGEESNIDEWLSSPRLAQISVDRFLLKVLGRPNSQNAEIRYLDGRTVKTDSEYLLTQGHAIEAAVLKSYGELNSYAVRGDLLEGVGNFMSAMGNKHIPSVFAETFAAVQKRV